jgi:hypothetical protein
LSQVHKVGTTGLLTKVLTKGIDTSLKSIIADKTPNYCRISQEQRLAYIRGNKPTDTKGA